MKKLKGNLYAPNETVQNYNDSSFEQLVPGLYYCKICQVKDEPAKEYLYVEYDIAEGPFSDYFEHLSDRAGFWGGKLFLSYTKKAEGIFVRALKAINTANGSYIFNPFEDGNNADEKTLVGKKFWAVFHEVEYKKSDGSTGSKIVAENNSIISEKKAKENSFNKKLLEKTVQKPSTKFAGDSPDFLDSSEDNPFA